MAYVRSLMIVGPMTAGLVVLASIITGLGWLLGATDAFVDGLHWSLYLTAVIAVAAGTLPARLTRYPACGTPSLERSR